MWRAFSSIGDYESRDLSFPRQRRKWNFFFFTVIPKFIKRRRNKADENRELRQREALVIVARNVVQFHRMQFIRLVEHRHIFFFFLSRSFYVVIYFVGWTNNKVMKGKEIVRYEFPLEGNYGRRTLWWVQVYGGIKHV